MRTALIFALTVWAGTATAGAVASSGTSAMIAELGLAATEARLAGQPAATGSDLMALGAVRFLRGIEKTLQTRWQYNAGIEEFPMPILDLPFAPNPAPRPFAPAVISGLFAELNHDMQSSREALARIGPDEDAALVLNLRDVWFDVNMNGRREDWEGLIRIAASSLRLGPAAIEGGERPAALEIRFDRADADWLIAYTHFLSGLCEVVAAFDPTGAIERVTRADARMLEILGETPPDNPMNFRFGREADQIAMLLGALQQKPDAARLAAARDHWLAMIAANRRFWARLDEETDNDREWIPNARQSAALGFEMPPETGQRWRAVLEDGEKLLKGELLVPFWRIAPVGGINLGRLIEDPPAVDIVGWVQGWGLADYMERGPTIGTRNLRNFEALVTGRTVMMMFLLN